MKRLFKIIFLILFVILGVIVIMFLKGNLMIFRISGTSMTPLLYQNDLVISIKKKEYNRKDVIVYRLNNSNSIKRIIGLQNEKIVIKDNKVFVNDIELSEDYIYVDTRGEELHYPYIVGSNQYFVLGDNRIDSFDSRFLNIQGIDKDKVLGKVFFSISNFKIIR